MKRFLFILSVAASVAACNGGGSNISEDTQLNDSLKQTALKDSSNYTTFEWIDSTFRDIGNVKLGQTVEIPFTIKNTGSKPLIISSVQPGCGCTVADKPEKPIMPGAEGKVVAKFNSAGQNEGSHTKSISVIANTTPKTHHNLTFRANVTK